MVEPIQGEGGVRKSARGLSARAFATSPTKFGLLLVYDEVQVRDGANRQAFRSRVGGRSARRHAIAKALGNGFPIGACLATERGRGRMVAGTHGSTFGGNPLATAAGNAVLDTMLEPGFFETRRRVAKLLRGRLEALVRFLSEAFCRAVAERVLLLGIRCVVRPGFRDQAAPEWPA